MATTGSLFRTRPESPLLDDFSAGQKTGSICVVRPTAVQSCPNVQNLAAAAPECEIKQMMSDKTRHYSGFHPGCAGLVLTFALVLATGCSSAWVRWRPNGWDADYGAAEARVAEAGGELLIFYRAVDQSRSDPTFDALRSAPLKQQTARYVRCSLYRSYEPDRRYVAQYGVERAPALIVVHGDGTYHARTGLTSAAQISEFLAAAQPPGAAPVLNPHIPRETNYAWHSSLESAQAAAQKTGQSILIVFNRWWSRDRRKLDKLLARHEVYGRFARMVHCRPWSILGLGGQSMNRFGVKNLPALVIVHPDGSHHVLELPTSYEAIVRFADRARPTGGAATSTAAVTQ